MLEAPGAQDHDLLFSLPKGKGTVSVRVRALKVAGAKASG